MAVTKGAKLAVLGGVVLWSLIHTTVPVCGFLMRAKKAGVATTVYDNEGDDVNDGNPADKSSTLQHYQT